MTESMIAATWMIALRKLTLLVGLNGRIRTPGKAMRRLYQKHRRRIWVHDFDGSLSMELDLGEHMQGQIFWLGYYNLDIVPVLDRVLRPGMTVVDVGANVGEITLAAARRVGETGRVIAFEPLPSLADQLQLHCDCNSLDHVTVVRSALADEAGQAQLFGASEQFHDGSMHDGLFTFYRTLERNKAVGLVDVTTLDKYVANEQLSALDMMKIDIEGAELSCLRGSMESLRRFRPLVLLELQDETARNANYNALELLDLLASVGYSFISIGRQGKLTRLVRESVIGFQNVLCVPEGTSLS